MEAKPQLISLGIAQKCLSDPKFFEAMPEFLPLKAKLGFFKSAKAFSSNCSHCAQRRMQQRIGVDFMYTVASLPQAAIDRFKTYIGASKIIVNCMNPITKKYESRIL